MIIRKTSCERILLGNARRSATDTQSAASGELLTAWKKRIGLLSEIYSVSYLSYGENTMRIH